MNRRQFTASLGALSGAAALPATVLPVTASVLPSVPTATYSWAKLIVRAQAKADPAMLARHLRITPDAARSLFQTLVRDGVLRAPSAVGVARAAQPLQSSSQTLHLTPKVQRDVKAAWEYIDEADEALVKQESPTLGCEDTQDKDHPNACTDQPVQESPQAG